MSPELNTALSLLIIGMLTVFAILLLIVISGKILIRIVNRYSPAEIKSSVAASPLLVSTTNQTAKTEASKVAVIVAAVEAFTGGKGKITTIKKKDKPKL